MTQAKEKTDRPGWARRLAQARKTVEPRQTIFARHLGISQPRYSQYESGDRKIPPEILERIAQLYPMIDMNFVFGAEAVKGRPMGNYFTPKGPQGKIISH